MLKDTNRRRIIVFFSLLVFTLFLGIFSVTAQTCPCETEINNCLVPITSLNGQGYTPSGVAGGLTVLQPGAFTDPATWATGSGPDVPTDTAILVIDEFGDTPGPHTGSYRIPDDLFSGFADDEPLKLLYSSGSLPHGALVFNHIAAMIQDLTGGATMTTTDDAVTWMLPSGTLTVVKVNAFNYSAPLPPGATPQNRSDQAANVIKSVIQELQTDDPNIEGDEILYHRFIFNMSFALVPCDVSDQYKLAKDTVEAGDPLAPEYLFDQYAASLGGAVNMYLGMLITPTDSIYYPDPLHYLIGQCFSRSSKAGMLGEGEGEGSAGEYDLPGQIGEAANRVASELTCTSDDEAIFVASAGNSGLPYLFYPAAYDEVTGVSALEDDALVDYSNYKFRKDIALNQRQVGGWFQLSAFTLNSGDSLVQFSEPSVYYRGTSFAGPVESVCKALSIPDTTPPAPCASPLHP